MNLYVSDCLETSRKEMDYEETVGVDGNVHYLNSSYIKYVHLLCINHTSAQLERETLWEKKKGNEKK